jgi:photosystem II stability/assembly factor-like uncharacterized protein
MKSPHWIAAVAVLLVLLSSAARAAQWFTLPNSPSAPSRHDDVWFTDQLNGWVVNGEGEIWHTSDGGSSWQQQAAVSEYLRSVTFVSSQHGWAGTLFAANRLYETTNGGGSWNAVPNLPSEMPSGVCGMWAASTDVVYAVGMYAMPAGILKTTNAGGSWSFIDVAGKARTLVDCYFSSPSTGFAVGSVGHFPDSSRAVVLRTTDSGATWSTQHVSSRMGEWGWKISFPSTSIGYVSMERFNGPMKFLKTTNAGITWTEQSCPNSNEQGIGFLDENVGWLGGWGSPTYSTTDGGETWAALNFMENLNRIRFIGDGLAFAVGNRVYRYGNDPTDGPALLASNGRVLSRSAPNPFANVATITLSISDPADVKLAIFDVAGRCVRTMLQAHASSGAHPVAWDGSNDTGTPVPAGVYFWRLEIEGRAESQKMLLVR